MGYNRGGKRRTERLKRSKREQERLTKKEAALPKKEKVAAGAKTIG
jgi:hypothetical protein